MAGDKMDTTTRWLSMLGIGALCFGISLFVLRIPIRTIIVFFIIGVPLVALWLYVDAKSKQQKKITTDTSTTTQVCICLYVQHVNMKKQRPVSMKTVHAAFWQKETLSSDIPLIHCIRTPYRSFTLSYSSLA
jgi:hypothetical protein